MPAGTAAWAAGDPGRPRGAAELRLARRLPPRRNLPRGFPPAPVCGRCQPRLSHREQGRPRKYFILTSVLMCFIGKKIINLYLGLWVNLGFLFVFVFVFYRKNYLAVGKPLLSFENSFACRGASLAGNSEML